MAFGLLNSIIPDPGTVLNLYTGPAGKLTVGKITINSKNYNPSRIQIGYKDGNNIRYFEYNRSIKYGETIQTEDIYLGAGQELVVKSTETDVNFLFYGQTQSDTVNPVRSGVLNHVSSVGTTKQIIYTAPQGSQTESTISIVNLGPDVSTVKLGISNAGLNDFDSTEYLDYGFDIGPGQTYTRPGIKLSAGQSLIGFSNTGSNISFLSHGILYYQATGLPTSDDLMVLGDSRITGNLGIGRTAEYKLDVLGDTRISGVTTIGDNLTVGGGLEVVGMSTFSGISVNSGNISITSIDTNRLFQTGIATFRGSTIIDGEEAKFQTSYFRSLANQIVLGYSTSTTFRGYGTANTNVVNMNQTWMTSDELSNTKDLLDGATLSLVSSENGLLTLDSGTTIQSKTFDSEGKLASLTLSNNFGGSGFGICTFSINGPADASANNGGIVIKGTTDKHFLYRQSSDCFESSDGIRIITGDLKFAGGGQAVSMGSTIVLTSTRVLGCTIESQVNQNSTDLQIPTARATYLAARNIQALNYWLASSNR